MEAAYTNWTVLITNPDATILSGPLALIAIQYNYDCSKTMIPGEQLRPATGYVMHFANVFNSTDVFASSQPFEVKAIGSTYPPQITTTGTPGTTATGTDASSAPSASPTGSSSNGAMTNAVGLTFVLAASLGVMGLTL